MNRNIVAVAAMLVTGTLLVAALVAGSSLPADARLPVHWGIDGMPDRFAPKWQALLLPVAITAGVSALFYWLPVLEPRREGLERSRGLYLAVWIGALGIGCVVQVAVLAAGLGWQIRVEQLMTGALGAMLVLIGNQLGKSRSMYLMGVRTPWTLASEEVWIKTHRLAGKLFVAGGVLLVLAALVPLPQGSAARLVLAVVVVIATVPVFYSLMLWRRESVPGESSE